MKLSQLKDLLKTIETVDFKLPDGMLVPAHFHVTEVGLVSKNFIDCGGIVHRLEAVSFQLWNDNDLSHKLKPNKFLDIIELSEKILKIGNHEIEVEYQNETIGKYNLDFNGNHFELINKKTACLAQDQCDDSTKKQMVKIEVDNVTKLCAPNGNCCS